MLGFALEKVMAKRDCELGNHIFLPLTQQVTFNPYGTVREVSVNKQERTVYCQCIHCKKEEWIELSDEGFDKFLAEATQKKLPINDPFAT